MTETAIITLDQDHRDAVATVLDKIETAQTLLRQAAETLSAVPGFADQWTATLGVYETIREHWHTIDDHLTGSPPATTETSNTPQEIVLGNTLQLLDEGQCGLRHYLQGRPVKAGTIVEVLTDLGWSKGRYEWSFSKTSLPYIVLGPDDIIPIGEQTVLRWPTSDGLFS